LTTWRFDGARESATDDLRSDELGKTGRIIRRACEQIHSASELIQETSEDVQPAPELILGTPKLIPPARWFIHDASGLTPRTSGLIQ
jgi:hypothetical protein